MPSFDIVSQVNFVEVRNAQEQANKEISNRFDFKDSDSRVEYNQKENVLTLFTDDEFKLNQVYDILKGKLTKRTVDLRFFEKDEKAETISGNKLKLKIKIKNGIEASTAKQIVKLIKDSKIKSQGSIQGDSVRVSSNKKDDLQSTIALLKKSITNIPIQFENYRD